MRTCEACVAHIEGILGDPVVSTTIHNLEPFSPSPSVVPEAAEETGLRSARFPA